MKRMRESALRIGIRDRLAQPPLSAEESLTGQVFAVQPRQVEDVKDQAPLIAHPHVVLEPLEVGESRIVEMNELAVEPSTADLQTSDRVGETREPFALLDPAAGGSWTSSRSFRARSRHPSYLISCSQSAPLGGCSTSVQSCGSTTGGTFWTGGTGATATREAHRNLSRRARVSQPQLASVHSFPGRCSGLRRCWRRPATLAAPEEPSDQQCTGSPASK